MTSSQRGGETSFQVRVAPWMQECFGLEVSSNVEERNHRFLEEALELVQAGGSTADECHQLVDYVYGRPSGELSQEVGGVMVTLAALCLAQGLDMHEDGEAELKRVWGCIEKIRAKQAAKPPMSPLPGHSPISSKGVGECTCAQTASPCHCFGFCEELANCRNLVCPIHSTTSSERQNELPTTIELAPPTPDQAEYLEKAQAAREIDPKTMIWHSEEAEEASITEWSRNMAEKGCPLEDGIESVSAGPLAIDPTSAAEDREDEKT